MWLNGDEAQGPVPFGLAIADVFQALLWFKGFWPHWLGAALPAEAV